MLSVFLKVLTQGHLDILCVKDLLFDDVAHILQNHVHLSDWAALDEVFHNFDLGLALALRAASSVVFLFGNMFVFSFVIGVSF